MPKKRSKRKNGRFKHQTNPTSTPNAPRYFSSLRSSFVAGPRRVWKGSIMKEGELEMLCMYISCQARDRRAGGGQYPN